MTQSDIGGGSNAAQHSSAQLSRLIKARTATRSLRRRWQARVWRVEAEHPGGLDVDDEIELIRPAPPAGLRAFTDDHVFSAEVQFELLLGSQIIDQNGFLETALKAIDGRRQQLHFFDHSCI
jgi:hypothetical protein